MMGPSKILTVSYGTFSCTLEGFDDPFATMRGIAEYFRDLAAEDRYFGAEPPTPDAEMLHRIAEREVQRRVEARVQDNGVVLRQMDGESTDDAQPSQPQDSSVQSAPARAAAAIAAEAQTAQAPAAAPAAPAEETAAAEPPAQEPAEEQPAPIEPSESVAAKLARIRAQSAPAEEYVEDEGVDEVFVTAPISAAFEDVLEEDQSAPEPAPRSEEDLAAAVAEAVAEPAEAEETETVADAVAEAVAAEAETAEAEAMVAEDPAAEQEDIRAGSEEVMVEAEIKVEVEEVVIENDVPAEETAEAFFAAEPEAEAQEEEDEGESWEDANVADPDAPAIARVIKMRREDFESAVQGGNIEEVPQHGSEEETAEAPELESTLSPEDEAELMATLEAVQRKAEAEARAEKEGRAMLENDTIEENGEAVSRILDVTNSEMEETEGSRRRSAIAHLKAAVAATRADKLLSRKRKEEEEDELNQYRQDLAKVVRPRRPSDGVKAKGRRIPPLVLVNEQRVDEGAPAQPETAESGEAVRPRRITSGNLALSDENQVQGGEASDNIFVESDSFAKFASDMGAEDLPDLLEAAAAYMAFVEGREHFSRPQIMQAVASLDEDKNYSREESLRAFGLLLRRGKIRKIRRGQFTISDTTRFKPKQLAVGE